MNNLNCSWKRSKLCCKRIITGKLRNLLSTKPFAPTNTKVSPPISFNYRPPTINTTIKATLPPKTTSKTLSARP